MADLGHFPFTKLQLPLNERVDWCASNPTHHRTSDYGIAISEQAIYLFSPFWLWLARWHRHPLSDIRKAHFKDSYWLPKLVLETENRTIFFRTPYDSYQDEMDFDRKNLAKAVKVLSKYGIPSGESTKSTPLDTPD